MGPTARCWVSSMVVPWLVVGTGKGWFTNLKWNVCFKQASLGRCHNIKGGLYIRRYATSATPDYTDASIHLRSCQPL